MKKLHNKILLSLAVITLVFGACINVSSHNIAQGSSSLESSTSGSSSDGTLSDTSFLTALASLNKIKIDTDLFSDKMFTYLKDNNVNIGSINAGRDNPFAPITRTINNPISVPKIATDQITQVTNSSAVLNGNVSTTSGVSSVYFKYGLTDEVKNTTENLQPSLVGLFTKNVSGLKSKTNYFFKACAKINNVENCGNVISFSTN